MLAFLRFALGPPESGLVKFPFQFFGPRADDVREELLKVFALKPPGADLATGCPPGFAARTDGQIPVGPRNFRNHRAAVKLDGPWAFQALDMHPFKFAMNASLSQDPQDVILLFLL